MFTTEFNSIYLPKNISVKETAIFWLLSITKKKLQSVYELYEERNDNSIKRCQYVKKYSKTLNKMCHVVKTQH